jgi:hypothetical protein
MFVNVVMATERYRRDGWASLLQTRRKHQMASISAQDVAGLGRQMTNVAEFKPLAEQPSLEAVMAAYPRQEGVYYLSRAYNAGMVPIPLSELLTAFQRYAEYCKRVHMEPRYIKTMRTYIELHCWEDKYPEPDPPEPPPRDSRDIIRESMEVRAAKGEKFAIDWLRRQ